MEANRITGREKQILRLVGKGFSNKEIAYDLSLSIYTIENHLSKIYRKLNVKDRFEAVETARKEGIFR